MRLSGRYLPQGSRSLESCCDCIGYQIDNAHAALADARASARLLAHYIEHDADFLGTWKDVVTTAQSAAWPTVPTFSGTRVSRRQAARVPVQSFLSRLASRTPREELHPAANSYLALLDRALLDRHISLHEADELVSAAAMMGLAREDAFRLHKAYLGALGRIALEDGIVTQVERADLELVATALGLGNTDVDAALSLDQKETTQDQTVGSFKLSPDDAVVFTGEAPGMDRDQLTYQAQCIGLRVTTGVSKKTRLVVAADPDSLSGKARKARDLGIPIVDYPTYLRMLGSLQQPQRI